MSTSYETALREMPQNMFDDKPTLEQCWLFINGSCGIYLRAFSQEILMASICKISLKITVSKLLPHLPENNNELNHRCFLNSYPESPEDSMSLIERLAQLSVNQSGTNLKDIDPQTGAVLKKQDSQKQEKTQQNLKKGGWSIFLQPSPIVTQSFFINSLWPSDAKRRHRSGSTLAQVMACCLTAPSHYLNQCWLIISKAQRHSADSNNLSHQSLKLAWKSLRQNTTQSSQRSMS